MGGFSDNKLCGHNKTDCRAPSRYVCCWSKVATQGTRKALLSAADQANRFAGGLPKRTTYGSMDREKEAKELEDSSGITFLATGWSRLLLL